VEDSQDGWDSTTDRPIPFAGTQANSSAWLKRAFPSPRQRGLSGDEGGGRLLAVHPHALDEHVPALVGPLLLAVAGDEEGGNKGSKRADSLLEFSESGEHFMELAILRSALRHAPHSICTRVLTKIWNSILSKYQPYFEVGLETWRTRRRYHQCHRL